MLIVQNSYEMDDKTNWKSMAECILSQFFKSKRNSNCLLKLEELLLASEEECVLSTIPFVFDVFSKVYSTGMLQTSPNIGKSTEYRSWLFSRYEDFISHLLSYLSHDNANIQFAALQTLLSILELEGKHPPKNEKENPFFPFLLFKSIVSGLASNVSNQYHLIKVFQEYTQYHDVKLYLLKSIQAVFHESSEVSEVLLQNCFFLLCSMKFPKKFHDESTTTFAYRSDGKQPFQLKEKPFRKTYTSVWNNFLSCQLSPSFLGKLLPAFSENILPHLTNPCLMTDFLTNSYNKGGILSLLALKGLYFLMDKYNLEYPDFFIKLYILLDKDIVNGKYSSKFFSHLHLFLSSTHMPAHIIAAFAKKLCRLSLISSTHNVIKILCLVSNLLANHPSLKIMIHQLDTQDLNEDPFCFDVVDPAKSNAMKSSLWEIQTLKYHVNPEVSSKAKNLLNECAKLCYDITEISSSSLNDMYVKLRKRKFSDVPLAVLKPVKQLRTS